MELIVGTNSYVLLEEAESIIENNLTSTDDRLIYWKTLEDNNKKILIASITKKLDIDGMCYVGRKADITQKMQFPRIIYNNGCQLLECPEDIKIGIILQMLNTVTRDNSELSKLQDNGIKSFSDGGGLSVSFGELPVTKKKINNIDSDLYYEYFNKYTITV